MQRRAVLELVFAGVLWGFGFIAATWSLEAGGPLAITGWRFALAGLIGLLFAIPLIRRDYQAFTALLRAAVIPGLLLGAALILQTWGLMYTTATKSGFLTCLYVLMVPAFESLRDRKRPPVTLLLAGAVALVGVAMMNGFDERSRLNVGDALTILCALAVTAHIFAIARIDKILGRSFDSFHFNTAQSLTAGIPCMLLALLLEPGAGEFPMRALNSVKPLIGFASLCLGSTLIAFALQVRAQKAIAPSLAALLFLLESPFAALFGSFFLGESLGVRQLFGCVLILAAAGYAAVNTVKTVAAH